MLLTFNTIYDLKLWPEQTSPIFHPKSRFCHVRWNVGMVCAITKFITFRKRRKKSCWMMLDEVCPRTEFHPTCFDAKVWIFHVGLVWWGVSSNIHKFSLISNVCTFELQFEFLNVFSNFEFRFNHKYLLWMRKAQDHVLQQRRTRYTRYDRESHLKEILLKRPKKIRKRRGTLQKRPNQKEGRIGRMRKYLCW